MWKIRIPFKINILFFFKLEIFNCYSRTFTTMSWYYLYYKHIDSYHAETASFLWYSLPPISVRVWFTIWLAFTPEVFISRNIITIFTSLPKNCWSLYGGSLKIDRKICRLNYCVKHKTCLAKSVIMVLLYSLVHDCKKAQLWMY